MKGINYLPKHQLHSVKTLFVQISREGVFFIHRKLCTVYVYFVRLG